MARNIEEINQEYSNTCALIGESLYKRALLSEQIKQLDTQINQFLDKNAQLQNEANEVRKNMGEGGSNEQSGPAN